MLAVILCDNDNKRIAAKYDAPEDTQLHSYQVQTALEKKIMSMIQKQNVSAGGEPEVVILDDYIGVYRVYKDSYLVVLGRASDNELILADLLETIHECLRKLVGESLEASLLVKNLESILLILDECICEGLVMELDANTVMNRCVMKSDDSVDPLAAAMSTAKDQIFSSIFG